jgi:hypothetical protein
LAELLGSECFAPISSGLALCADLGDAPYRRIGRFGQQYLSNLNATTSSAKAGKQARSASRLRIHGTSENLRRTTDSRMKTQKAISRELHRALSP